ncbi:MAG: TM0106 family RecB-like putative nuclease [Pseudomonadota bacterium]
MLVAQLLIKPSDAKAWTECARRVWLDNKAELAVGPLDGFDQMVIDFGLEHERAVLERLSSEFNVREATSVEETTKLMAQGVDIIYQAQLLDEEEGFIGFPDFLIRHASGAYQPADAKLALSEDKKELQVQLGLYRRMLNTELPAQVFLGDGSVAEIGDEADKVTDRYVSEMRDLLSREDEPSVRYAHSTCVSCIYYDHCKPGFVQREELSLLYGVRGRAAEGLEAVGIETISSLAASDPATIPDVPYLKGEKNKKRVVLQAKSWFDGRVYQMGDVELPEGEWVHFDIEDNPLTETGTKHVYLWGFLTPDYGNDNFEAVWTDGEDQDYQGWLGFLDKIEEYRQRFGQLVLAHYSPHERSTIKSYATRYAMEEHRTVTYLLGDESPLFDLRKPVVDNLVLPLQAYGLKDICKHPDLVNFQWEDEGSGSQWSIVQFNRYLAESDLSAREELKTAILGYNRDDVTATRRLEEWLRGEFG